MSNLVEVNNFSEDINIDKLKGRSMILSHISLRVTLAYLDILYISYVNRMKAQNNNLSWFNQTEQENFQLLYSSLKRGNLVDWNKTYGLFYSSNVYVKNEVSINNISD